MWKGTDAKQFEALRKKLHKTFVIFKETDQKMPEKHCYYTLEVTDEGNCIHESIMYIKRQQRDLCFALNKRIQIIWKNWNFMNNLKQWNIRRQNMRAWRKDKLMIISNNSKCIANWKIRSLSEAFNLAYIEYQQMQAKSPAYKQYYSLATQ